MVEELCVSRLAPGKQNALPCKVHPPFAAESLDRGTHHILSEVHGIVECASPTKHTIARHGASLS